jgi:hypothetical protein
MKGYSTFVFGLLRLGYQSAILERMRGEEANRLFLANLPQNTSQKFIALVGDGDE